MVFDKNILIKNTFDNKIKIGIFEMSNVPNFNKFNFGTNLGLIGDKYFIKLFLTFKSKSAYLKYWVGQFQ